MTRERWESVAEMQAAGLRVMREEIRRLRRLRALGQSLSDPRGIILKKSNLLVLQRLYPGFTIPQIKALFPLRKVGSGPGTRYILLPREVDRWLDELPRA